MRTRAAVSSRTLFDELSTLDTVAVETPALRATERISIGVLTRFIIAWDFSCLRGRCSGGFKTVETKASPSLCCFNVILCIIVLFDLEPDAASTGVEVRGAGRGVPLSRYERNDEVEPNRVVPLNSTIALGKDGVLIVTLPHESVIVVRVKA